MCVVSDDEISTSDWPRVELMEGEGLRPHLPDIAAAEPALREKLTVRVYEVVRARLQLGNVMQGLLNESHRGVRTASTWSTLFSRPLDSLSKRPVQLIVFLISAYFIPSLVEGLTTPNYVETRHVRFEVLETRDAARTDAGGVGVSGLTLLRDGCRVQLTGNSSGGCRSMGPLC